jgi:hypothetical protein
LLHEIQTLVPPGDAERIARVAAGGNAREACRLFFRATHFPDGANSSARGDANESDRPDSALIDANDTLRRLYRFDDMKFPHDYYDQSARVEEETHRFAESGFPNAGDKSKSARRVVALEMEDDTDESEEEGGDLPGHRDR